MLRQLDSSHVAPCRRPPPPPLLMYVYAVKIVYFETKFDKVIKKYLSAHLRRAIFYPFVQIYPLQAKKNR